MTPEERDALDSLLFAKHALLSSIQRCEIAGLSEMNVLQPLRDALSTVLGVRDVIEGKV